HDAVGREVRDAVERIGHEARLGLLAVRDHGRARLLEALDRLRERLVLQRAELLGRDGSLRERRLSVDQVLRSGDAADGLGPDHLRSLLWSDGCGRARTIPLPVEPVLGAAMTEPHPPITQTSARSLTDAAPATPEVAPGRAAPEPSAEPAGRTVRMLGRTYPFVAPNIRDPRLHLAAVIISIHVLGQIGLGFRVSVPQILVAILVCAVIEVGWTLSKTGTVVWPASAMLTGSGVALILRLSDMRSNDHWSWRGWYVFALVAGLSLLTKYLIRFRGSHIFNPSNVGLVAAFLVLGRPRIDS